MHLKSLTLINWGTYEPRTFEFQGTTLITGANGSGKSMLFDAIQTVLTASHANIVRYNVAQAEDATRDRNKAYRTLQGYALGQVSNHIQREAAQSWVAAVFEPEAGTEIASNITALVGIAAHREGAVAVLDTLALYLIRGEVEKKHLITAEDRALTVKGAKEHFFSLFGKQAVHAYAEAKSHYLCDLYGWLESKGSVPEAQAQASARALARSISAKPIKSVHELVREEMLDERDLSDLTRSITGALRDLHQLSADAKRLQVSVAHLKDLEAQLLALRQKLAETRARELAMTRAQVLHHQRQIGNHTQNLATEEAKVADLTLQISQEQELIASLRRTQVDLAAQIKTSDVGARAQSLEQQIEQTGVSLTGAGVEVLKGLSAAAHLRTQYLSRAAVLLPHEKLGAVAAEMDQILRSPALDQLGQLDGRVRFALQAQTDVGLNAELAARVQQQLDGSHQLATAPGRFLEQVEAAYHAAGARGLELKELLRANQTRIASLGSGKIHLPDEVEDLLAAIRRELPGADPSILADHVEPRSTTWQPAIEGYLGRDRYAILVRPEFESRAIGLLKSLGPSARGVAKIAQIRRLREAGRKVQPEGSIIEELSIGHPDAERFLWANYGDALKLESTEEALRAARRGITLDGRKAGGFSTSRFAPQNEDECIFGQASRKRNLERALVDQAQWEKEAAQLRGFSETLRELVRGWPRQRIALTEPLSTVAALQKTLTRLKKDYAALDRTEIKDLLAQQELVEASLKASEAALQIAFGARGGATNQIEAFRISLANSQAELARAQCQAEEAQARAVAYACLDETAPVAELEQQAGRFAHEGNPSLHTIAGSDGQLRQEIGLAWPRVATALAGYNTQALGVHQVRAQLSIQDHSVENLMALSVQMQQAVAQVRSILRDLEGNALARANDSLEAGMASFNSTFTSNFAMALSNAIEEGVRPLKDLNNALRGRVFGHDSYRVDYPWVPEYKEMADFVSEITRRSHEIDTAAGKTLFDLPMDPVLSRVRDRLRDLLLGEDVNAAEQELTRLTDYRNYRNYDIMVKNVTLPDSEVSYSRHGMFSGGENKTPIYVVRAAALSTALRHNNSSRTHLYMLFLDEAFHAMDTKRSRETLELQHQVLGFQVLVALPTQDAGKVRELFDRELQFAMVDGLPKGSGTRVTKLVSQIELKKEAIERTRERTRARIEQEEHDAMAASLAEAAKLAGEVPENPDEAAPQAARAG